MTIMSMTGYGRVEGQFKDWSWVWEVRSVNGKSLDSRLRLPPGFENLDPQIRKQIASKLNRGNLQISLTMNTVAGANAYKINHEWLETLIVEGKKVAEKNYVKPATLDGLYRVYGVITEQTEQASDPRLKKRNDALLKSLNVMLVALVKARRTEGDALAIILSECVRAFEKLCKAARKCDGAQAKQIKKKYVAKLGELLADKVSEEKLLQEIAILAVKADVREELDRLDAHIAQAKSLIIKGSPIGRKIDFLSQEFIREINTMCSKSTDIELTQIGLEMKSLIEQFREQAANVE
ncbi:MAG: YicC family protein [Robiginitomaculum sp.]|nr:MAG: YicC family protein [Robiginitomaculum sp.]